MNDTTAIKVTHAATQRRGAACVVLQGLVKWLVCLRPSFRRETSPIVRGARPWLTRLKNWWNAASLRPDQTCRPCGKTQSGSYGLCRSVIRFLVCLASLQCSLERGNGTFFSLSGKTNPRRSEKGGADETTLSSFGVNVWSCAARNERETFELPVAVVLLRFHVFFFLFCSGLYCPFDGCTIRQPLAVDNNYFQLFLRRKNLNKLKPLNAPAQ